ncbi:MAG: RNA polymerase B [Pycnora praestabilis]|nr:MAG: RNA polymerase B [Pycnora praestabilis]
MSATAPTSRTREQPQGDEEAAMELKLGEFQNVPTLTLSEARLLINAVMDHRKQQRKVEETEMLVKTQDYLDVFARFKQKENIEAVERMLAAHSDFESFERSQLGINRTSVFKNDFVDHWLGTLCCESAEEAKTLIPSLANKVNDTDLQELLDEITKLRNFVE